ncbi:P-loop containing nucleoside triphosphate hydrolase protein [Guyanagaster necrorhizus]|uniref:P-loop containing nucleoside triphosphate hydrolase protein n=1 Tax=Guyanagaster necrorhizus TaxID=856835 RepID=A0A9P7VTV5_9AGAR|nr:P-loop containing nucleoside triphosphate hydrolase protein [Guyanagaster necrorhizus MCA 3950]KAG7445979.1 P-loop containing nucleoside triphosphate hydrolase protein [Guyanagaster necrorhizus MCA 3950]
MPRIRKTTSNRSSTNDRRKLQTKVRESKKKKAKAAEKNPQWKSKQKKDPGIPNEFPYKDQILAEVQEQRRLALEEKQQRKDAKKAKPATEEGDPKGFDPVASIAAKHLVNAKIAKMPASPRQTEEAEDDDEEVPVLVNRDLPTLKSVLDHADVLLEVLDCRDPLAFRSSELEKLAPSGRVVFLLNKIDTCPKEAVAAWVTQLRFQQATILFRSASAFIPDEVQCHKQEKGKGKLSADNAIGVDALLKTLLPWAKSKSDDEPLVVAVAGFTNTGKSSVINSVAKKAVLPTYTLATSSRGPTTTVLPQEITIEEGGKKIKFVDTPGLLWADSELTEESRTRDILMRNKGRIDRLKEPIPAVVHIVSRANNEDLMLHYSLPAFSKGDVDAFLPGLARSHQFVKKRGKLDLVGASRIILREWNLGKLRWYTMPASKEQPVDSETDKGVLTALPTRRELRKHGGLLKLSPGVIDTRLPSFEEPYLVDSEGGEEDDDTTVSDEEDEEEEYQDTKMSEEEEEEEEEEPPSPPLSSKQKRKRGKEDPLPPSKKLAFSGTEEDTDHKRQDKVTAPKPEEKLGRKVTNKAPKSKPAKTKSDSDGTEAYDFGKFF